MTDANIFNEKDLDAADDLFSEDHELHPETPGIGRGGEGMKRAFAGLHEQFPDVRVTIESMVAEGGRELGDGVTQTAMSDRYV